MEKEIQDLLQILHDAGCIAIHKDSEEVMRVVRKFMAELREEMARKCVEERNKDEYYN